MTDTQGGKANKSGKILEEFVTNTLTSRGFRTISHKSWLNLPEQGKSGRYLINNAPYTSIYSTVGENAGKTTRQSRSEFIIADDQSDTFCRVECKWQAVSGSVDEKLPYLYLNAVEAWQESEIIILIDGNGWKNNAIAWLKKAVDERRWRLANDNRNIYVFNMGEFVQWSQLRFN